MTSIGSQTFPTDWARNVPGRDALADLAVLTTIAAIVGLFAISPMTLDASGISYTISGGGFFSKFHPSTVVAVVALGLRCLANRSPVRLAWRLVSADAGVVLLLAAVGIAGVFAALVTKTPVTPLVDTFVSPILMFLLLKDLDPRVVRWIAILVVLLFIANAAIAIAEFLRGTRLIQLDIPDEAAADPTRGDVTFNWRAQLAIEWRSSALFGHPLVNGLMVGSFVLCLLAPGAASIPLVVRMPILLLQGAAMFTFGARAALVLTVVLGAWLVVSQAVRGLVRGARLSPRAAAAGLLLAAAAVGGGLALVASGFLDKTIERFSNDAGSSATRLTMLTLIAQMPLSDLLLVPDKGLVATLQRMYGLEFGIESSWIGLALTYGLVVTGILVAALAAFTRSVVRMSGRGALTVFAFYFILISVTASMSGKTTTFAMTVILVMVFLRKDRPIRVRRNAPAVVSV